MIFNNWMLSPVSNDRVNFISNEYDIDKNVATILVSRGVDTFDDIQSFFNFEISNLESPFNLIDMDKAVNRIKMAIDNFEKIIIYGDYDCDGVTSTTILYLYLNSIGANVDYYIPSRSGEGYGLNCDAISDLKYNGADLIITVDNGISAIKEAEHAFNLGVDLIITDHHHVGDILPNAYAVINPNRSDCSSSFKKLAGVGVAFKLIVALEDGDYEFAIENFGDILAIGTIGDIVPLVGENRYFVKRGLDLILNTDNIGISALLEVINFSEKQSITSENVAFGIVPRINAAGRMLDASIAVKLLISDDYDLAFNIAQEIDNLNSFRKDREKQIIDSINNFIDYNSDILNNRVLVFYGENWDHGVIGIVCSKILERYGKPVLILSIDGDEAVGSARSLGDFSLYNALDFCKDLLVKFGGHKLAAGMTILKSNIGEFIYKINYYAKLQYEQMPIFSYNIDMELDISKFNLDNAENIYSLSPFGCDNQNPIFLTRNLKIENIYSLSDNKHIKLYLSCSGTYLYALKFNISKQEFFYKVGDTIDIIYNIDINEYNGKTSLSLLLKDIRYSYFNQKKFFDSKKLYNNFIENKENFLFNRYTPTRDEIGHIYKYIKKNNGFNYDIDYLYYIFSLANIDYFKFKIIINILNELKLINISPRLDKILFNDVKSKVDLNESKTFKMFLKNEGVS